MVAIERVGNKGWAWGRTAGRLEKQGVAGWFPARKVMPLAGVRLVAEATEDCRTREPLGRGLVLQARLVSESCSDDAAAPGRRALGGRAVGRADPARCGAGFPLNADACVFALLGCLAEAPCPYSC